MSDSHRRPLSVLSSLLSLISITLLSVSCASTPKPTAEESTIVVAAAADLAGAFEDVGREFQAAKHIKVVFNFGSSGMLTRQIENGAPMDVFAAANVAYVNELEEKGLIVPGTKKLYARGRITLWTLKQAPVHVESVSDLTRPDIKRVAIANPEHAPYGMAAKEALERTGVWDSVKPKLVYGENIRQTLQYAQTGNVEVAIVALSLSLQSDGRWVLIPENLHSPLDQGLGVIKGTTNEQGARAFADFVMSAQGQAIMNKYGFTLPAYR